MKVVEDNFMKKEKSTKMFFVFKLFFLILILTRKLTRTFFNVE